MSRSKTTGIDALQEELLALKITHQKQINKMKTKDAQAFVMMDLQTRMMERESELQKTSVILNVITDILIDKGIKDEVYEQIPVKLKGLNLKTQSNPESGIII